MSAESAPELGRATIKVKPNGPFVVEGDVTLTTLDGQPIKIEKNPFSLCRCGQSKNKPFCDGAHKGCAFETPSH